MLQLWQKQSYPWWTDSQRFPEGDMNTSNVDKWYQTEQQMWRDTALNEETESQICTTILISCIDVQAGKKLWMRNNPAEWWTENQHGQIFNFSLKPAVNFHQHCSVCFNAHFTRNTGSAVPGGLETNSPGWFVGQIPDVKKTSCPQKFKPNKF